MKEKPKISVIIPTYNEEHNIKQTLIAVQNQICDVPYEIIVADGQSTDNTVTLAKNFAKVYISPKKGKAFQVNYVIPKSSGELIVFLDADTLIEPTFLKNVYKIFERHENLFACSARLKYYNGKAFSFNLGSRKFIITSHFFQNVNMHFFYFFKTLLGYPELTGCDINVRREVFLQVGGFKQPPKSLGIDKVFSDAIIYLTRKMRKGRIRTLNFMSVLTSGRHLSARRSIKRIAQYHTQKDIYYELAKSVD